MYWNHYTEMNCRHVQYAEKFYKKSSLWSFFYGAKKKTVETLELVRRVLQNFEKIKVVSGKK